MKPKYLYCQIEPKLGQVHAASAGMITMDEVFEDVPDFGSVTIYKVPNKGTGVFYKTLEEIEDGSIELNQKTPRARYVVLQTENDLLKTPCEGEIVDHLGGSVSFAPDYDASSRYRLRYGTTHLKSAKSQVSILLPALESVYQPDISSIGV